MKHFSGLHLRTKTDSRYTINTKMTYGIEWNIKPSRGEEAEKKEDDIKHRSSSQLDLLDLPTELLVMILYKMGYDELRSIEQTSSYFRYKINIF